MQDRYVGDAGDYAKYSLLNALSRTRTPVSLGILWYRYPDESHNGDGRHISYLKRKDLSARDPETHAALCQLVASGNRSIAAVECSRILPIGTVFVSKSVAIPGTP